MWERAAEGERGRGIVRSGRWAGWWKRRGGREPDKSHRAVGAASRWRGADPNHSSSPASPGAARSTRPRRSRCSTCRDIVAVAVAERAGSSLDRGSAPDHKRQKHKDEQLFRTRRPKGAEARRADVVRRTDVRAHHLVGMALEDRLLVTRGVFADARRHGRADAHECSPGFEHKKNFAAQLP